MGSAGGDAGRARQWGRIDELIGRTVK
jgi:hypothetical protein